MICGPHPAIYSLESKREKGTAWIRKYAELLSKLRVRRVDTSHIVSIVDDDDAVRLATASLIRSFGWDVNDFASAEAYLNSGRTNQTSFLISDIRMPGMSGIELHNCLLKQGYAPPTIFITAFPTAVLHAQTQAQGALALLEKPVDANVIAHWLTTALGNP